MTSRENLVVGFWESNPLDSGADNITDKEKSTVIKDNGEYDEKEPV